MLVDSGSVGIIINIELFEQINNKFQLSSTKTSLVGWNNVDIEMIGETYVKLEICRKKLSTKIIVTNDVV